MENFITPKNKNTKMHNVGADSLSQNIAPILDNLIHSHNSIGISISDTKISSITTENTNNRCKKKKKKKNRCSNCNKYIGFIKLNCRCSDKSFCSACILPELHNCNYDFKKDRHKLEKKLVRVCNEKIIKI
jgi:hypothetical protein